MSQWHRAHPELTGTDADPWMQHESYRKIVAGPSEDRIEPDVDFDVKRQGDEDEDAPVGRWVPICHLPRWHSPDTGECEHPDHDA